MRRSSASSVDCSHAWMRFSQESCAKPIAQREFAGTLRANCLQSSSAGLRSAARSHPTLRSGDTAMADLFENPMGLMGFEFVEFASPDAQHAGAVVREARLHAGGQAPLEGRRALPPGRHQLHRQPRAEQPRRLLRRRARPLGLRHGVSGQGFAQGLRPRAGARRPADRDRRPARWSCACRPSRASAARRST